MLGKLIKYEMKSMSRTLIPLWILAPVVSLLFSMSLRGLVGATQYSMNSTAEGRALVQSGAVVSGIVMLVFFGVMVAILVLTVLFVIQRFWNGLLKEEGYLMFTLPVETWELVTSKGISATIVGCISSLVAVVSCIMMVVGAVWTSGMWAVGYLVAEDGALWWSASAVLFVLLFVAGIVESVYRVYAAMSLGQLFEGHRVVGACVSYIGIGVAWSVLSGIFMVAVTLVSPDWGAFFSDRNMGMYSMLYLLFLLLATVLQIAIWHLITVNILSKRLNLE